ncbi:HD-GYP domain-containing protein [Kangiella shandongensis]|uniref:HD-GYP domain-containing protein n=1 Tax=Kangiella shandongensis TaxID=2763258 RepID=UPI001CBE76F0|nr:HD-GYP domain-containing protein [Kangiella shandongensis]
MTSHKIEKKKIPVSKLCKGMTVVELDRPWTDLPVIFQEITIKTDKEVKMLRKYCQHVYIDHHSYITIYAQQLLDKKRKPIYIKPDLTPKQTSASLREELPRAKNVFDKSHKHINDLMRAVQRDSKIDIESSKQLVSSCVDSILSDETAMFWLSKIKNKDEYTSEHCLRVGILSIAFGKYLQLPRKELELLGLCGILHDVGKMKVPQHILNKEGSLTQAEYQIVKEHTVIGYVFLRNHGGIDEQVCTAAYNHHERMNGLGYPRKVSPELLSDFDRIIAIVDSYDAMISDRCYRKGIPPSRALSRLYKVQGSLYDSYLIKQFIQMVGVYPVGSLVELSNGQVGIVLSVNENSKLEPVIELVTDTNKKRIKPIAIDLTKHPHDEQGKPLRISKTLADSEVYFDLESFIHGIKDGI